MWWSGREEEQDTTVLPQYRRAHKDKNWRGQQGSRNEKQRDDKKATHHITEFDTKPTKNNCRKYLQKEKVDGYVKGTRQKSETRSIGTQKKNTV